MTDHALYRDDPDYTQTPLALSAATTTRLRQKLEALYGPAALGPTFAELQRLMRVFYACRPPSAHVTLPEAGTRPAHFSEQDAILITYGDLIQSGSERPLHALADMVHTYLRDVFNILHILPFFPYSSDRGFAVIDFKAVDPRLGTWEDITAISKHFRLMFDGVFNHISSRSPWFKEYLDQNPDYVDFFTVFGENDPVDEDAIRRLFRPRTSEVLTTFETLNGPQRVWTTFGPDQVDLKFQNPKVLLKMVDVLLFYVRKGASLIRLDAVTYLWDELGSSGVHLWQTHSIISLFRDILDAVAPHVALVTETNVPHADNISYFGNGQDEAQMVYNFALPPLILHTFHTADVGRLSTWAESLVAPSPVTTFLNFLDSHDGIGLPGARGILSDEEINALVERIQMHGGLVSFKKEPDGAESPYEMNITSYSALNADDPDDPEALQLRRYLSARAITMMLPGVPGVYLHGLLGSRNDSEAILRGEEKRNINRRNLDRNELFAALDDPSSTTARVATGISRMLRVRRQHPAFHPTGLHRLLETDRRVFAIERVAPDGSERIVGLCNVSHDTVPVSLPLATGNTTVEDVLHHAMLPLHHGRLEHALAPYETLWLQA